MSRRGELLILIALAVVPVVGIIWFNLWESGYLGSYWERWEGKGNITCFDAQGRQTTSNQYTCYVLTLRGIKARERLVEACKAKGQSPETCLHLALHQLTSHLPSTSH